MSFNVVSWNLAAINNNPFEYWITYEDESYTEIMRQVEQYIQKPAEKDVSVGTIFTEDMFQTLAKKMRELKWEGIDQVEQVWNEEYKERKIITQFLTDKTIGLKRLTSMPDRFTNTINEPDSEEVICRPSVINAFEGDVSTTAKWFDLWLEFFFNRSLKVKSRSGSIENKKICELLVKIQHSKYPAISEAEEQISIPLQLVCLAIFDCVLIHIMNDISGSKWLEIKQQICEKLNKNKVARTSEILEQHYSSADIICLQEVSSHFARKIQQHGTFKDSHFVVTPSAMDHSRDQNSILLLKSSIFDRESVEELTERVLFELTKVNGTNPLVAGDLIAVAIKDVETKNAYVVASFHGDTNGLATKPVLRALVSVWEEHYKDHKLIFGLDANTYKVHSKQFQGVEDFGDFFVSLGLTSCFGDKPDPENYTTFNARTFLQAQLSKAVRSADLEKDGDINLKDYILFQSRHYEVEQWKKDNTGSASHEFINGIVFPTLDFPSDHAVLSVQLRVV